MRRRVVRITPFPIVVAIGLLTLSFVLWAAWEAGQERRASKNACHALGEGYHYWSDRDECVRYVDPEEAR